MMRRTTPLMLALLLSSGLFVPSHAVAVVAPDVRWTPSSLESTVAAGEVSEQQVSFRPARVLRSVSFAAVPEIAGIVRVVPASIASVPANVSVSVTLRFEPAATTPLGTYRGTIQLKASGKLLARPLPLVIHVGRQVDASGGTVASPDGSFTLEVPPGAVSGNPIIVTVGAATGGPPAEFGTPVSQVLDLGPDGTVFERPVTLSFTYDPSLLPEGTDETRLRVAFEDATGWLGLPTDVEPATNVATAQAFHFTRFAIVTPAQASSIPGPVTGLNAEVTDDGVLLTWTPGDHYAYAAVRRAEDPDGPSVLLAYTDKGETSYLDAVPLGPGSCYWVSAVSQPGFESEATVLCLEPAPPEPVVLYDALDAQFNAGECHFGGPASSAPDYPWLHDKEKLCAQGFGVDRSFIPRALSLRLYAIVGPAWDGVYLEIHPAVSTTTGCQLDRVPGPTVLATSRTVSGDSLALPPGATDAPVATFVFDTDIALPAGDYWFVARTTGGAAVTREYAITTTRRENVDLEGPAWGGAANSWEDDGSSFYWCGDQAKVWRSRFEIAYPGGGIEAVAQQLDDAAFEDESVLRRSMETGWMRLEMRGGCRDSTAESGP